MHRSLKLAAVAFCFHVPGLRALTDYPISRELLRTNAIALAVSLAAAAIAAWASSRPLLVGAVVFTVGHFAWSTYLALRVSRVEAS